MRWWHSSTVTPGRERPVTERDGSYEGSERPCEKRGRFALLRMSERIERRNTIIGAITIGALLISFILAIVARRKVDVPVVVVAPVGTVVTLDGDAARQLPAQPNTPSTLASYYFLTNAGAHEVGFQEPGRPGRVQLVTIPETKLPVILTLLRDTLREMKESRR